MSNHYSVSWIMQDEPEKSRIRYTVVVEYGELTEAAFSPFDRALLNECKASDKVSDKIFGLETIARRVEEAISLKEQKKEAPDDTQ